MTIHILSVKTRFGDYVQAFSTPEKRDAAYCKLLTGWWRDDREGEPPADLQDLASEYFDGTHDDDNDAECDDIELDTEEG